MARSTDAGVSLNFLARITVKQWDILLLVYCFAASIMPMWLLLQPRGYLGGWLLYLTIFIGLIGAILADLKYNILPLILKG